MSSSKKYWMMGITVVLLPLGKALLRKLVEKLTEESEPTPALEETEEFTTNVREFPRRAR